MIRYQNAVGTWRIALRDADYLTTAEARRLARQLVRAAREIEALAATETAARSNGLENGVEAVSRPS